MLNGSINISIGNRFVLKYFAQVGLKFHAHVLFISNHRQCFFR